MIEFDKDTYPTPLSVFNPMHEEFNFTIDGAALPHNTKCERYITPEIGFSEISISERTYLD
ncbi:DNA N-6-adenine-methyltransferase [Gallibacterium anatis]|uniref:DNA N-6-adenine-methyltransferase n=1 Tax=Gallibacterium anatis TaxID=750 RepID=UPI003006E55B